MKLAPKFTIIAITFASLATGTSIIATYIAFKVTSFQPIVLWLIFASIPILFGGLTVFIFNLQIAAPIRNLSNAVARIRLGDLTQTIQSQSHDELGALSRSFNEMTHQLSKTYRNLQVSNEVAKEGQAKLEASIQGLRQGFILTNIEPEITLINEAAMGIFQKNLGVHVTDKRNPATLQRIARMLPVTFHLLDEVQQTLNDQKPKKFSDLPLGGRFLNIYLSPVLNESKAIGCAILIDDITEERILQRSRDEFFSIASHELRTPLTAIRGNTSMILEYFPEALKDQSLKESISDIHNAANRLIEIVNDFLDTSRLEQDKMKFTMQAFALESLIEKVIYELGGVSRDKKVAIHFDQTVLGQLPLVYADPERTTQIIYNLIGNALKFTEQGSITLNCFQERTHIKVCVSDTGPGISPEGQQILFHKFQQSTASILTRDNTRGTGLGLYISKLLVEHMGGTIRLEHSEVGKGSTFSFTLPLATKEQISTTVKTTTKDGAGGATQA